MLRQSSGGPSATKFNADPAAAHGGLVAIVGVSRRLLPFQAIDLSLLSIDLSLLRSRALFALLDLVTDQATRHETNTSADRGARSRVVRLMSNDSARSGAEHPTP
jgi:hypothetical protein